MGRPEPCVLFAQSFIHSELDEYVDEVVFAEPVVVTACEFLEQNSSPSTPNISLIGATSPPSFALEVFVHCEGESRFRRLCQPFLYSHSSSNVLEVEAVVTSHLVLRGSYRSLTLVIYGNTAEDLGQFNVDFDLDNTLGNVVCLPSEGRLEDLPPALHSAKLTFEESLSSLGVLSFPAPVQCLTPEVKQFLALVLKVFQISDNEDNVSRLISIVVSCVSSYVQSANSTPNYSDHHEMGQSVDNGLSFQHLNQAVTDAKNELLEIHKDLQPVVQISQSLVDESASKSLPNVPTSEILMEMFFQNFCFLSKSSAGNNPCFSENRRTILALGLLFFFCLSRESCYHFVHCGGMEHIVSLICSEAQKSTAITLLLLRVVEVVTRHEVGCESFLGWWPREHEMVPIGNSDGYCHLLKLLLNNQRHDIASLAAYILQRLRLYEVASRYELATLSVLANLSSDSLLLTDGIESMISVSSLLKQILKLLKYEPIEDPSPATFARRLSLYGQLDGLLSYGTTIHIIDSSKYAFAKRDMDTCLLSLLKERGFIPLSAALLSSPKLRSENGKIADIFVDIATSIESIFLDLLFCRSGLTFLLTQSEATALLMYSMKDDKDTSTTECMTLSQAAVFLSKGFFCRPQEVGMITDLHLRVGSAIDCLLRTGPNSDDLLWVLWELCAISRSDCGRQAVLAIGYFPEAIAILIKALQSFKNTDLTDAGTSQSSLAIFHSASEILEFLVTDSNASSLRAWIGHAMELHKALYSSSPGSNRKDAPTRLLEWIDAAIIYHQNGAVGLLRYSAILASGGDAHFTSANVLVSDSIDADSVIGDSLNSSDTHVDNLLGKLVLDKQFDGIILHNSSIVKLATAVRILAFISENSDVAASLYEEGAVTLVFIVLVNCKSMLERLSSTYDYLVDEGAECSSTSDLLSERNLEESIIDLLVPSLTLLIHLLRKLHEAKEQYRNTKLLNALLRLHREVSPRLSASSADLLFPYPRLSLSFATVCHLLASALACWPVFGWTPGLFHCLLESVQAASSLALGPKDACSVLCLLGDLFPVEDIWQWRNEMPQLSALRTLSVGAVLGPQAEEDVNWYTLPGSLTVLLVRLTPQLDRIAQIVLHFAFTDLVVIQDMLRVLIIRIASQRTEYAIVLVRPIISWLDSHIGETSLSEMDIIKVHKLLNFIASLLEHPCAKTLLLKVEILRILEKVLERCSNVCDLDGRMMLEGNYPSKSVSLLSWSLPAMKSLTLIFSSQGLVFHSPVHDKCVDDDASLEDGSVIACLLLKLFQLLPVGRELLACMVTFKELASSSWGRSAIFSIFSQYISSCADHEPDEKGTGGNVPNEYDLRWSPTFLNCMKKLLQYLHCKDNDLTIVIEILYVLSLNAVSLAMGGQNKELRMLKSLFGLPYDLDRAEGSYDQRLKDIHELIEKLEESINLNESLSSSSSVATTFRQVRESFKSLLLLLQISASPSAKLEGVPLSQSSNSPSEVVHSVVITSHLVQSLNLTPIDDGVTLSFSHVWESNEKSENVGSDNPLQSFAEKCVWECPDSPPSRQLMPVLPVKKKLGSTEGSGRRARDNSGSETIGPTVPSRGIGTPGASSGPTRRDTFRQRKPNTSRPPSMHVDDYVARERNIDNASSSHTASTGQRVSGRPPSIHVDEFMARQRERQNAISMAATDASQVRDASEARNSPGENNNADKLDKPHRLKADLDDDLHEIDIVFDDEPEPDDRSPFPQTDDNLQPAPAVAGESSPGSVVEESEVDAEQTISQSHMGTPSASDDGGSPSGIPTRTRRLASRPETAVPHEAGTPHKNFARPSGAREQSDESKYSSPVAHSSFALQMSNISSTSIEASAPPNFYQRGSPQKAVDGSLGVGFQGYREQKHQVNQPPLPPMPPPNRPVLPTQAAEAVQSQSSSYVQTAREMQPPLPTGYPIQLLNVGATNTASGRQQQVENMSSVATNSLASLTATQTILDPKYAWNLLSSATKLQAESFNPSVSLRPMPPLPPLPPPFSSPTAQSSATNSSCQTAFYSQSIAGGVNPPQPSTPASDSNVGNFPVSGSTLTPYSMPPFSPALLNSRTVSSPGTLFSSSTQQPGQNSSAINQSSSSPQTSVQSTQSRPPLPPPPHLPRPPYPPQHPMTAVQGSQSQSEHVMHLQQNPFQMQVQPLQIPQLQIPQFQLYYQPQQQEPLLQPAHTVHEQTKASVAQAENATQQQKESGMTLQQFFSSPEAIQSLLGDREKLCQLLEQHPKLVQMLQERLGQQ